MNQEASHLSTTPVDQTPDDRASLAQQKQQLEEYSYTISKKLYMKEFNLALMKGVAIIGLILFVIAGTLAFFVPRALAFAITAILISLLAGLLAFAYNKGLQRRRAEKEKVRQEYREVCRKLDQFDK